LVGKIQEQINDARQARQNEKMAREISENRSQLSYLMMDTSGANNLAASSLEQSIAEQE
jgi:hypothetical protein